MKTAVKQKTRAQLRAEFIKATKLWEILKMALADLARCERMNHVTVDMSFWHKQSGDNCVMCLAGSAIHCRLASKAQLSKVPTEFFPDEFRKVDECEQKLIALNELRCGWIGRACARFIEGACPVYDREIVCYENGRKLWWSQMRELLRDLKKADI